MLIGLILMAALGVGGLVLVNHYSKGSGASVGGMPTLNTLQKTGGKKSVDFFLSVGYCVLAVDSWREYP